MPEAGDEEQRRQAECGTIGGVRHPPTLAATDTARLERIARLDLDCPRGVSVYAAYGRAAVGVHAHPVWKLVLAEAGVEVDGENLGPAVLVPPRTTARQHDLGRPHVGFPARASARSRPGRSGSARARCAMRPRPHRPGRTGSAGRGWPRGTPPVHPRSSPRPPRPRRRAHGRDRTPTRDRRGAAPLAGAVAGPGSSRSRGPPRPAARLGPTAARSQSPTQGGENDRRRSRRYRIRRPRPSDTHDAQPGRTAPTDPSTSIGPVLLTTPMTSIVTCPAVPASPGTTVASVAPSPITSTFPAASRFPARSVSPSSTPRRACC